MGAQRGKDLLVKLDDGSGNFITMAGLRTRQLAFNAALVDVTNSDSIGRWRELLAGAGVRRAAVSGAGVFKDEASDARMRQIFFDGVVETLQLAIPAFGTITGPFQITALEYRGDHAGEITFDATLESAGAPCRPGSRPISPSPPPRSAAAGACFAATGPSSASLTTTATSTSDRPTFRS